LKALEMLICSSAYSSPAVGLISLSSVKVENGRFIVPLAYSPNPLLLQ